MSNTDSRVTIHMAASLDGFIARKDGRVDWLETSDEFAGGDSLDPGFVEAFLKTIDCYVMGSRTYETALSFEAKGFGWSYGDKPTFVLTSRDLPRIPFFENLDRDIPLHLAEVKAYKSGMVELCYDVRGHCGEPRNAG
jgi:dihydrofolate reductase